MATTEHRAEQTGPIAFLRIVRRRLAVVAVCVIVVPASALAFSLAQEKQYSASASLLFRDPQFDQKLFGSTALQTGSSDPAREAATNVRLVSLEAVAARAARALQGKLGPGDVQGKVAVAEQGQSDVVSITATDHDPAFAARLANTFGREYINFRRAADRSKIASAQRLVQAQLGRLPRREQTGPQGRSLRARAEQLQILTSLQTGNAELVQPAAPPSSPSSPKPARNTVLGFILGLLLGTALALLLERLDRRLKDPRDIADAFDRPILGAIPESRAIATADHDAQHLDPADAESFRMLRASLRYFNIDHEIHSVLITSAAPGDGKSTVAMHLAAAGAGAGAKVLLIEADLRHPVLAKKIGLPASRGLSQLLAGEAETIEDLAHRLPVSRGPSGNSDLRTMDVLVAGPIPPNPTDLIESDRMRDLIQTANAKYDLVVIDTPPTSVVSDAIPLVKQVSGVIVVCRLGKTTRESAGHLHNQLVNLEANTLGVVVNSIGREAGSYGYGYGYGYGSAESKPTTQPRRLPPPTRIPPPRILSESNGADAGANREGRRSGASVPLSVDAEPVGQPAFQQPPPIQREVVPPQRGATPPQGGVAPPERGAPPPQREVAPPQRGMAPPQRGMAPPPRRPATGTTRRRRRSLREFLGG